MKAIHILKIFIMILKWKIIIHNRTTKDKEINTPKNYIKKIKGEFDFKLFILNQYVPYKSKF